MKVSANQMITVLGRMAWNEIERSYLYQKAREDFEGYNIEEELNAEESMINNYMEEQDES